MPKKVDNIDWKTYGNYDDTKISSKNKGCVISKDEILKNLKRVGSFQKEWKHALKRAEC